MLAVLGLLDVHGCFGCVLGYWVLLCVPGCALGYWVFLCVPGCALGYWVFLCVPGCALGYWVFGRAACQIWLTLDVLYCTASIWNLCVIAFDRFTATMYPVWYRVLP